MYRLPGERVKLDLDGPTVEVEPIRSWMIQTESLALAARLGAAEEGVAEYAALKSLYEFFVAEAQPTWDIGDHRGAIPNTAAGMMRLPLALASSIISQWQDSLPKAPAADLPSAVDILPDGPGKDEVKRRLRSVKAA